MLESQLLHEGAIIEPEKANEANVEFLKTDLDVGITFVKIACTSADNTKLERLKSALGDLGETFE